MERVCNVFYCGKQPETVFFVNILHRRPSSGLFGDGLHIILRKLPHFTINENCFKAVMSEKEQHLWSDVLKRRLASAKKGKTRVK